MYVYVRVFFTFEPFLFYPSACSAFVYDIGSIQAEVHFTFEDLLYSYIDKAAAAPAIIGRVV